VTHTPLLLPTIVVLMVAAAEWRHTRAVAWAALVAGFVLALAAMRWPTLSLRDVTDVAGTHLAALLAVARTIGAGCFLWSVVRSIRTAGIPW
jgi:hypothetical protein